MPADDMPSVAYRILRYFDACQRKGVDPNEAQAREVAEVGDAYYAKVMRALVGAGYVSGVEVMSYISGATSVDFTEPSLTLAGAEHLDGSPAMQGARAAAGTAFEAVVSSLVLALVKMAAR